VKSALKWSYFIVCDNVQSVHILLIFLLFLNLCIQLLGFWVAIIMSTLYFRYILLLRILFKKLKPFIDTLWPSSEYFLILLIKSKLWMLEAYIFFNNLLFINRKRKYYHIIFLILLIIKLLIIFCFKADLATLFNLSQEVLVQF